jgi:hypothetical protein
VNGNNAMIAPRVNFDFPEGEERDGVEGSTDMRASQIGQSRFYQSALEKKRVEQSPCSQ